MSDLLWPSDVFQEFRSWEILLIKAIVIIKRVEVLENSRVFSIYKYMF